MIASALRRFSFSTVFIFAALPLFAQNAASGPWFAAVDSAVTSAVRAGQLAGLAIAVVKGNDTLLSKGYGFADVEDEVPITPRTVFRIGSVTKQFTAAAVMQLVEQGKIGLDDDITKYLKDYPTHKRKILVRHLLNHTSGIPSYTDIGPRWGRTIRLDLPHDSLLAIVKNDSLMFEPGMYFYYNNTGYYLLGVIIERVTGMKYGDYLAKALFGPLGLQNTMYCDVKPIIKHRADGYELEGGRLVNADYLSMNQPFSAGALCSTVGDLIKWTRALHSGKVVSSASFARMTTPEALSSKRTMTYGYGLGIDTVGTHRIISHGGGINGFISDLRHYPDDSLTIAVLANTSPAPANAIGAMTARLLLSIPATVAAPPKDLPMTAADRAPFIGSYLLTQSDGTKRQVRIYERGDSLMFAGEGPQGIQTARLRWQGGNVFLGPGRVTFDVSGGKATGFVFGGGARAREAVRTK